MFARAMLTSDFNRPMTRVSDTDRAVQSTFGDN